MGQYMVAVATVCLLFLAAKPTAGSSFPGCAAALDQCGALCESGGGSAIRIECEPVTSAAGAYLICNCSGPDLPAVCSSAETGLCADFCSANGQTVKVADCYTGLVSCKCGLLV